MVDVIALTTPTLVNVFSIAFAIFIYFSSRIEMHIRNMNNSRSNAHWVKAFENPSLLQKRRLGYCLYTNCILHRVDENAIVFCRIGECLHKQPSIITKTTAIVKWISQNKKSHLAVTFKLIDVIKVGANGFVNPF